MHLMATCLPDLRGSANLSVITIMLTIIIKIVIRRIIINELWPKPFEPFVLICCAIADASRNTDAPKE